MGTSDCLVGRHDFVVAAAPAAVGWVVIEFGLQTWNEQIRREVLHRRETNEDAMRAFGICDRQRLWYDVDHMFNLPGESEDDHIRGVQQYRQLRYLGRINL